MAASKRPGDTTADKTVMPHERQQRHDDKRANQSHSQPAVRPVRIGAANPACRASRRDAPLDHSLIKRAVDCKLLDARGLSFDGPKALAYACFGQLSRDGDERIGIMLVAEICHMGDFIARNT